MGLFQQPAKEDEMDADTLHAMRQWVRVYLERDEEIIVPIKKMWNEWHAAHDAPPLGEFTAAVLADPEVEEMRGVNHADGLEEMDPDELADHLEQMERDGFYSGPRAKLRSREITADHIAKMLKKHNDRMEAALHAARALIPEDADEADEGKVIDILAEVEELRRGLRKAGLEPPEDIWPRRPSV
jgi:hypothetical protein